MYYPQPVVCQIGPNILVIFFAAALQHCNIQSHCIEIAAGQRLSVNQLLCHQHEITWNLQLQCLFVNQSIGQQRWLCHQHEITWHLQSQCLFVSQSICRSSCPPLSSCLCPSCASIDCLFSLPYPFGGFAGEPLCSLGPDRAALRQLLSSTPLGSRPGQQTTFPLHFLACFSSSSTTPSSIIAADRRSCTADRRRQQRYDSDVHACAIFE